MTKINTYTGGGKKKLIQLTLQRNILTIYPLAKGERAINNY